MTSITIPDGVTSIGEFAFTYCSSLTRIEIPDSVTEIGNSAFGYCSSLTSIEIPDSVTSIGYGAFENCHSLTEMTLPFVGATKGGEENTHLGYIFGASSYLENIDYVPASLKKVTVTGGSIGYCAFYNCSSLTSVVLGDGVASIGRFAFMGCNNLTSLTFEDTNTWYVATNATDWENKAGGTEIPVVDDVQNATYFLYSDQYWYKK